LSPWAREFGFRAGISPANLRGMTHRFAIRVYYEDTDMGGIVYHANFLKFIERARSEWVAGLGLDQNAMRNEGIVFAVRRVEADYLIPARFDDLLTVETEIAEMRELDVPGADGKRKARLYIPKDAGETGPLILFLHGGGYAFCDLDTHDGVCRRIAAMAQVMRVSARHWWLSPHSGYSWSPNPIPMSS